MAGPDPSNPPANGGIRTGFRFAFRPQALVMVVAGAAVFYTAQGAVVGFVHSYWSASYRVVTFEMQDWRPNDGSPYVAGRLVDPPGDSPFHLAGATLGGKRVLEEVPTVAFEPGARVPVWYSPEAPLFAYNGEWTNAVPVAALPERPGWGKVVVHALAALVVAILGVRSFVWVAKRASGEVGALPPRR